MRSFRQLLVGFLMIRFLYEYLYFNLYQWSARVNGINYYNNYSACIMLTVLLLLNLFTVLTWFDIIFGFSLGDALGSKIAFSLFTVVLAYLQFHYFSYKDRYKGIISRYSGLVSFKQSTFISLSLCIFSLSLLFVTWFIGIDLRR